MVELAFRLFLGDGPRWQTGYYSGNPLQSGVWQVPAGQSIHQAQGNVANRLSTVPILSEFRPSDAAAWKFQVQADVTGSCVSI